MPRLSNEPEAIKPYSFHGVELNYKPGDKEALADECPWCGKSNKFSVNLDNGLARCWSCQEGGDQGGVNPVTFLRKLLELSSGDTTEYEELRESRGLIYPDALIQWDVCRSLVTGHWLVPGYGAGGGLNQLYKYSRLGGVLIPTPGMGHQLHGVNLYDQEKEWVYLCEGVWDALVLYELLGLTKEGSDSGNGNGRGKGSGGSQGEGELVPTGNKAVSLLSQVNVLAVPGCKVFKESWLPLFKGKQVVLFYDSDHPKLNPKTKGRIPPAGYVSLKRVAGILGKEPASIGYLKWGEQGYDPELPTGTDLREVLCRSDDLRERIKALEGLLAKVEPIPAEWISERKSGGKGKALAPRKCEKYEEVVKAWTGPLDWTPGLDKALSVMLASVVSTKVVGDQLWVKIVGPASCGKSTLCEALAVNHKYVMAKSSITGFHSGYKTDKEGDEDNSLISKLDGKTLVTKDGDTLLTAGNLSQILAEARDLYDCVSRTHYRNKVSRDYAGIRMTWILCGTSSLRSLDNSELGERFLDCVIMDGIDDESEDRTLQGVARRTKENLGLEADGKPETHYSPDQTRAMQLTGGYVEYLRDKSAEKIGAVKASDEALDQCIRLGKFVAYMRARPSLRQDETVEREFATRLVSQLVRLASCLAVVLNRQSLDEEVMSRVRGVALDTSRGLVLDIVTKLYQSRGKDGKGGLEPKGISIHLALSTEKVHRLLRFLKKLGVVTTFTTTNKGIKSGVKWRLTEYVKKLYGEVVEEG